MERDEAIRRTLIYHERTKHHLNRYARSSGALDWANQPDPFRTYSGSEIVELPLLADALTAGYDRLYIPGAIAPRSLDENSLSVLFELALGLSAWKEYRGNRWALRCNPSSGNLHPTEGYAVVPTIPGVPGGVYHYVSRDHILECRCRLPASAANALPPGCFLLGLSSIHWREAWKYGERAFRYCQHDIGHALAAFRYAAACLGWSVLLLDSIDDATISHVLGLDRDESFQTVDRDDREYPDCLMLVCTESRHADRIAPTPAEEAFRRTTWFGRANRLSPDHVNWWIIDDVAAATHKTATPATEWQGPTFPPLAPSNTMSAARLIRQRRSCLSLDGKSAISADRFFGILDHTLPRPRTAPWDLLPWSPHIHLGIFVHRVTGLVPGLYLLARADSVIDSLKACMDSSFVWEPVEGCPAHLRLFLLRRGDFRERSQVISCRQEIASDGAFSLGMLADFGESIRRHGAWWYRRLFWESGILGQVLYLEAEASGVRGTGIGCYFDDLFHDLLGLKGDRFQSLYHFTIGGPIEDTRLRTTAPYATIKRQR